MAHELWNFLFRIDSRSLRFQFVKNEPQKFETSVKFGAAGLLQAVLGTGTCILLCFICRYLISISPSYTVILGPIFLAPAAIGALICTVNSCINSSYQRQLKRRASGTAGLILAMISIAAFTVIFVLTCIFAAAA